MRPWYNYDDDNKRRAYYSESGGRMRIGSPLTPAVKVILTATIGAYILQLALLSHSRATFDAFMTIFAFQPARAVGSLWLWQFLTYAFLHASFLHIAFNMFFFWMVGGLVEGRVGTKRFVWLYLLSGGAGALVQAAVSYQSVTIGASAAVMGVAAAAAVLYSEMPILFFFIIPMKMKHFLWVLVFFQILGASAAARGNGSNIAYFAHLAGLGAGYLFVRWYQGFSLFGLTKLYRRITGRFRGLVKSDNVTHIDDDARYQQEVDRILDKIFKEGTTSLTREENDFLKKTSQRYRK